MTDRNSFTLQFQKSPILFTGGIAAATSVGGTADTGIPIIAITQSTEYQSIPTYVNPLALDTWYFDFYPMSGSTLAENEIATYPFANQAVAANAVIAQPLRISLLMLAPVKSAGGYNAKSAVFNTLKTTIQSHTALGGTYTVLTPSGTYFNCILTSFKDISEGDPGRPQDRWQWDFVQPLLTAQSLQAAQNQLMSKIGAGVQVSAGNVTQSIDWTTTAPVVPSFGQ